MYANILICTDGSERAAKAVDHGLALAKHVGAKVTFLTATEPYPMAAVTAGAGVAAGPVEIDAYEQVQDEEADRVLKAANALAEAAGVPASTVHVRDSAPADAIVATAIERGCDLIVMASHGRGPIGQLFLGSQTSDVLANCTAPVLVIR